MKRNESFELDSEFVGVIEDTFNGDVDFQFDLDSFHSDAKNLLQSFVQSKLIKQALKSQYNKVSKVAKVASPHIEKLKNNVGKSIQSEKLKEIYEKKKKQLESKITAPPFLRTSDKVAFTLGIIVLCITEFILLKEQTYMPLWYTVMFFPLMVLRYFFYKRAKFQYFMLDFCYAVQAFLLFYMYVMPSSVTLFQIIFAMSNGPLAMGAVMWRNSLVFHDLDKLTSVFIHIFPPLVTFCMRWYPVDKSLICFDEDCGIDLYHCFVLTFAFYTVWQLYYLIQTEVIDKKKLDKDPNIITSARYMSRVKPHPIWLYFKKRGAKEHYSHLVLAATQYVYTFLTLLPIIPIYNYFTLHALYLSLVFIVCVWNGANFYFEIFTETYTKRVQRYLKEQKIEKDITQGKEEPLNANTAEIKLNKSK